MTFYTEENRRCDKKVNYVLRRLPENVADRVINECGFIYPPEGLYIPKEYYSGDDTIIINFAFLENIHISLKYQRYVIAHEIAHFILNHKRGSGKNENEVKRLVKTWGF